MRKILGYVIQKIKNLGEIVVNAIGFLALKKEGKGMNVPRKVILHCAGTPDSGNLVDAATIDDWHRERGWSGIGYHWVIKRDGVLESGRAEDAIGAHTLGHNKNSLGVCLVGTYDFTSEQIDTLVELFKDIRKRHQIKPSDWFCHYQFANKDCPNIPVEVLRALLRFR